MSVGSRDEGSGGQITTWSFGIGGSGFFVGTRGAGGADGRTPNASDDSLDPCTFGTLLNAAVNAASVIGNCSPVAICDANAWSSDAGVAACSPFSEGGTLDFVNGDLVVRDAYGSQGCWPPLVFDGEGRLISGAGVDVTAWADCRWAYYAGKSFYYYCVSE